MKRALMIVGGIVALLAIGWGLLWNAGREQVNARLDAEIAAMKARGTEVTYAERTIGGFPTAYEVRATDIVIADTAGLRTIRLPELVARTELADTERMVVDLPPTFTLELTPTEEARATQPNLAESYLVEFETIATQIITSGIPGAGRAVETNGESFLAVYGDPGAETSFAIELAEFTSRTEHPPEITEAPVTMTADIGLIDYVARGKADTGAPLTFEGNIKGLQVSGSSQSRSLAELEAIMAGELAKGFDLAVRSGSNISRVHTGGSADTPAGSFTSQGGASSALLSMKDGIFELKGDTRATQLELVSDSEETFKGGAVEIEIMDFTYSLPLVPSPDMQPFALKLALVDVAMDDKLWGLIDPTDALDRAPAELILDTSGTMRTTRPNATITPGAPPPFEFGNVSLNDFKLNMLGISAKAKGDMELLQPLNLPIGQVDVELEQVDEVLETLAQSGVLPPNNLLLARIMLNSYTVLGDAPGIRKATVEMSPTGILVNGESLGGP